MSETRPDLESDLAIRDHAAEEGLHPLLKVEVELKQIGLHRLEGPGGGPLTRVGRRRR